MRKRLHIGLPTRQAGEDSICPADSVRCLAPRGNARDLPVGAASPLPTTLSKFLQPTSSTLALPGNRKDLGASVLLQILHMRHWADELPPGADQSPPARTPA